MDHADIYYSVVFFSVFYRELQLFHVSFSGIVWNDTRWKDSRRFALTALRDFGLGKASVEQRVQEEAQAVADVFDSHQGVPFKVNALLPHAVSNIICSIVFGNR